MPTRKPAVAGSFYPAERDVLRDEVDGLLREAASEIGDRALRFRADRSPSVPQRAPKALIVPHAGYIYSGPIAASAYARLTSGRDVIRRVVLVGPSHYVRFSGLAISPAATFGTPLGEVPVDPRAREAAAELPFVTTLERAHAREHSLEVQLPFLQRCLAAFTIVPLVTGETTAEEVRDTLDRLWDGPETLLVISSDLSHYEDYPTAQRLDLDTTRAIEALRPQDIAEDQACGRLPICGLLLTARRYGLSVTTLDVRNSGDTSGSREAVVGYGAYMFA